MKIYTEQFTRDIAHGQVSFLMFIASLLRHRFCTDCDNIRSCVSFKPKLTILFTVETVLTSLLARYLQSVTLSYNSRPTFFATFLRSGFQQTCIYLSRMNCEQGHVSNMSKFTKILFQYILIRTFTKCKYVVLIKLQLFRKI